MDRPGPRSASSVALGRHEGDQPVARRHGGRAEQNYLAGQMRAAAEAGDGEAERRHATALARLLAARGAELDTATRLARHALLLDDDPQLRRELAGWFAGLGEPALAAATLKPLLERPQDVSAAKTVILDVALYLARAGDVAAAAETLVRAARNDPEDPNSPELFGSLGAWDAGTVLPLHAALGYLDGALRREARGESSAAFEDLLRGFELCPRATPVAERLAAALQERGRFGARDEVKREHANALGVAGVPLHLERFEAAAKEADWPRAMGAALDARLDGQLSLDGALRAVRLRPADQDRVSFDELLERIGLYELLLARVELLKERTAGAAQAEAALALGRLYAGPLGDPVRAATCWVDALAADPGNREALESLQTYSGSTLDQGLLIDALRRVAEGDPAQYSPEQVSCLSALVELVDRWVDDPTLTRWGIDRLQRAGVSDEWLNIVRVRVDPQCHEQDASLRALKVALSSALGQERTPLLRRAVALLRGRPDDEEDYLAVLTELAETLPDEAVWQAMLDRVLERTARWQDLGARAQTRILSASSTERERGHLLLSALARREGDFVGALAHLDPLLTDDGVAGGVTWGFALTLASEQGDRRRRAQALFRSSRRLVAPLRATLCSVAAESWLDSGDPDRARAAGEEALQMDPSLPRAAAVRARIAAESSESDANRAPVLERAMGVLVPRSRYCECLAEDYERQGESTLALAWTKRWLALRPGDPRALSALLRRVSAHAEPERIADALGWLLSQPQPLASLIDPLCQGLRRLAESAPSRVSGVARRSLDVLGPRDEAFRETLLEIADRSGEPGLAITVLERWLAAGSPGSARPEVLLDLSRRRRQARDADGAARALVRALDEGAHPESVLAELHYALPARSSDGEVALLRARAEALSALSATDSQGAVRAWREYGAACWDLALDRASALSAWERVVGLDPERGVDLLALDLTAFAGSDEACEVLEGFAHTRTNACDRGRVLTAASATALQAGKPADALRLARLALEQDATQGEALALAERAASPDRLDELESLYQDLASQALGPFGERALHYRAARQLERRGDCARALSHAICALECVPGQGASLSQVARLAERSGQVGELARALSRIAAGIEDRSKRAEWLRRAALYADESEEGQRQRVDALLRALAIVGDPEILRSLGEAIRRVLGACPEDTDILRLRYQRAVESLLRGLAEPKGAVLACEVCEVTLTTFSDVRLAWAAVHRALDCDPASLHYEALRKCVSELAKDRNEAERLLTRVTELYRSGSGRPGRALLDFAADVGQETNDFEAVALLLLEASAGERADVDLLERAEAAARRSGDPALLTAVLERLPLSRRVDALVNLSEDDVGDAAVAAEVLSDVLSWAELPEAQREPAVNRLAELYVELERPGDLVRLLTGELNRSPSSEARRSFLVRRLVRAELELGESDRALSLLESLGVGEAGDAHLWADLVRVARETGDRMTLASALSHQVDELPEGSTKGALLRELATLLGDLGDPGAGQRWSELAAQYPEDPEVVEALEREAERAGDFVLLVDLLERRAKLVDKPEDSRRLRLRRALVLDQRLGRPDQARAELGELLESTGDNLPILRVLADLHQRLGDELRAAPLWLRASNLARDPAEAARVARRACEAYLKGGDHTGARHVVEAIAGWAPQELVLELRVEVERSSEDPRALAKALEDYATRGDLGPEPRALLLIEAARAAEAAGEAEMALACAQKAARIGPMVPVAQLIARLLEYRARGAGNSEEARVTVAELRGIEARLSPAQAELRAFLIAEALDVAVSPDAGIRELERASDEVGSRPLIALGLAERLAAARQYPEALDLYDSALGGDLRGLRAQGQVALRAAMAAYQAQELERALRFLDLAAVQEDSRPQAEVLRREIQGVIYPPELTPRQELPVPEGVSPFEDDLPPIPLTRRCSLSPAQARRASGENSGSDHDAEGPGDWLPDEVLSEHRSEPPSDPHTEWLPEDALLELTSHAEEPEVNRVRASAPADRLPTGDAPEGTAAERELPPVDPVQAVPAPLRDARDDTVDAVPPRTRSFASGPPAFTSAPGLPAPGVSLGQLRLRRVPRAGPAETLVEMEGPRTRSFSSVGGLAPTDPGDTLLYETLASGSVEAGVELLARLERQSERTHDRVSVCRHLVKLRPGDELMLDRLHGAAVADRNIAYALAVDHVRRAFKEEPLGPPPLSLQREQPDRVRTMLYRGATGPAAEALGLVWEGACHLFKREPASYGVTGVERVSFGAGSAIGRTYAAAARLLGLTSPLFARRGGQGVLLNVALTSPASLIVTGDVEHESPQLAFHLGAMLAATMPEYCLLFGVSEEQARGLLKALAMAFGPPTGSRSGMTTVAKLAEALWESMSASAQRRLRELCDDPAQMTYEIAIDDAVKATRRAGLFVSGDLGVAVRETCAQVGLKLPLVGSADGLVAACAASEDVADLVVLATSPEYAEARWQWPRSAGGPSGSRWS